MATKTPRIQVTLSERSYEIVTRLAELQQSNRSRIIAELVNDLAPVMGQLLETMEAAARVREENVQGVRDASREALERLQPLLDEAEESMGLLDLMLRNAAEPEPPTSNTGVTMELTPSDHTNHPPRRRRVK
jgi:metal-responsive CopG/Arc/MetJ family transcriptional regulator